MHRIHIDIPLEQLGINEAQLITNEIAIVLEQNLKAILQDYNLNSYNYRLGHDEDRTPKNYMHINENGHASKQKIKVVYEL